MSREKENAASHRAKKNRAINCEHLESRTMLSVSPQVVGYVPDYEFSHFSSIDLSALTWINYFSITPSSSGSLPSQTTDGYTFSQLQTAVAAAHAAPSRVGVSIVIDPATPFQTIAQSSTATNAFVSNIISFCQTYHLDGIDLDYEPGTLTTAQMNAWGGFLATLHAQTSANGLVLSEAVQVSQMIIPKAYISDVDRYNVMVYALQYNSSAPYSLSISYLNGWVNYGVPKQDLIFGMPFYGSSGTSWSNSTAETYAQIVNSYYAANGSFPAPNLDSVTINGVTWGFNGIDTVENKTTYALQNGFGGVMIWELGQDYFTGGGYGAPSLLPAIKSTIGAAWETWTGAASSDWTNPSNWNFGQAPASATNVVINKGTPTANSPFSVNSLSINGGALTLNATLATYSTSALSVSGGTLNIGSNIVNVNYGPAADPIAAIAADIRSGYNAGSWTGKGITSSAAAANATSYGIGYADAADANNPASLATGQLEFRYTLLGDANLDGKVNGADFAILAAAFNQAVSGWDQGDFNYDGAANGADFAFLAGNFNQGVAAPAIVAPAAAVPAVANTTGSTSDSSTATLIAVPKHRRNQAVGSHVPK